MSAIPCESPSSLPGYLRYWGKAGEPENSGRCHRLAFHCLDVAAVGVALAAARPAWLAAFANLAQVDGRRLSSTLSFLLALHDLGKFGDGFQRQRPDVARHLGREPMGRANKPRHDTLGYLLWSELAEPTGDHPAPAARLELRNADGTTPGDRLVKKALWPWVAATTGHHGRPPEGGDARALVGDQFGWRRADGAWADALAFVVDLRGLMQPATICRLPGAPAIDEDTWRASSWWLAGFATLCDWVGSNTGWFPFQSEAEGVAAYWVRAQVSAERAVKEAGLEPPRVASFGGFKAIFEKIDGPSPLQVQASEIHLGEGPQLFLLEDLTGSGKTEAALSLVARLFDAKKADGFYFALPTMATSNAMYARVDQVLGRLFEANSTPSFVLAHSGPNLTGRAVGIGSEVFEHQPRTMYGVNEPTASEVARNWLGDSRKKALLADAGVGTIDQALVGALQARHNTLRLLGLHGHVLVVDEVHACDEYMNGILMELLRLQAANGGSAVLLSATLPLSIRLKLVQAFREGLGVPDSTVDGTAYPALVRADRSGVEVVPVAARPQSERVVNVEFLETFEQVVAWCGGQAKRGKCVAWIRNTVGDALEAFDRLVTVVGADRVQLFHARFPMGDRLNIEQDVVRRFGSTSSCDQREGRIVVSTQVMEQSLDLDFDEMVSDLAPIDWLIQRAGRLHRHPRGRRGEPVLQVMAPAWNDSPGGEWPGEGFKGSVAVYGRPSCLWRTQRVLRSEGQLELPAKARKLVEAVYGADDSFVPDSLLVEHRELKSEGEQLRNRAMAQHNKIRLELGYVRTGTNWSDDEFVPTRLGDPTTTLRLVRSSDNQLAPWSDAVGVSQSVRWRLGEVSVRTTLATSGRHDEESLLRARLAEVDAEPPAHVVPIEMRPVGDEWHGNGLAARGPDRQSPVVIVFKPGRGLEFRSEKGS